MSELLKSRRYLLVFIVFLLLVFALSPTISEVIRRREERRGMRVMTYKQNLIKMPGAHSISKEKKCYLNTISNLEGSPSFIAFERSYPNDFFKIHSFYSFAENGNYTIAINRKTDEEFVVFEKHADDSPQKFHNRRIVMFNRVVREDNIVIETEDDAMGLARFFLEIYYGFEGIHDETTVLYEKDIPDFEKLASATANPDKIKVPDITIKDPSVKQMNNRFYIELFHSDPDAQIVKWNLEIVENGHIKAERSVILGKIR